MATIHYRLLLFFTFIAGAFYAQVSVTGCVKDTLTNEPVPFCAVGIKKTNKGCITNEEGIFKITVNSDDTLVVSNVTYRRFEMAARILQNGQSIYISPKGTMLEEVIIYDKDDYLYQLFESCRNHLLNSPEYQSKAYFVLETEIGAQPVELLECYYNARCNKAAVLDLGFKNGRVGLAPYNDRFFVNRNTSKAISFLSLTNHNAHMPVVPLQLSKRRLKKNYRLSLKQIISGIDPIYHIAFTPLTTKGDYFSGEAWIEKNGGRLRKIVIRAEHTKTHPFLPYHHELARIEDVSMQITKSFEEKTSACPDHLDFNYQINYHHLHNNLFKNDNPDTVFEVKSKGVVYFYDYNNLFYLPYFNYDAEAEDYRKITSLTRNDWFWDSNNLLVYSEQRKKEIAFFKNHGVLMNYKNAPSQLSKFNAGFFENNYIAWSAGKRLSLKKDGIRHDTIQASGDQQFIALRYKLKAQIFLDLNQSGDTMQHYSSTLFDVYESYYNIPEEPATNCFINIYFDLVEMERRKMERELAGKKNNAAQMEQIYRLAVKGIEKLEADYFEGVSRGKNLHALEKWNQVVKLNLGIDNFDLFKLNKPK